jgi:MFS family permease
VAILAIVSCIAYMDRQIITVLLEPIKLDLGLSDTALGLLAGAFFALFYLLAGIPLGHLTDIQDRRKLLGICLASWSVATALCGLAQNYVQLAISRALVAIGEAGVTPVSASIVGDIFPPEKRTGQFATISVGAALGISLGVVVGGVLNAHFGWRSTFLIVAAPGAVLSLILLLFARDAGRSTAIRSGASGAAAVLADMGRFFSMPTYVAVAILSICSTTTSYAALAWMPSFMARLHGMDSGRIGASLGGVVALGLTLGLLVSGWLGNRLSQRDVRWLFWIPALALSACLPLGLIFSLTDSTALALFAFGAFSFFMASCAPTAMTIASGLVDPNRRGLIAATMPLYSALGGAIGPFFVGALNDGPLSHYGQTAIRYSLAASCLFLPVAIVAALWGARTITQEYRTVA